jgi:signal transduction histidine kinase
MTQAAAATLVADLMRGIAELGNCSSEAALIDQLTRLGRAIRPHSDLTWHITAEAAQITVVPAELLTDDPLLQTLADVGDTHLQQLRRRTAAQRARFDIIPRIERCLAGEPVNGRQFKRLLTQLAGLLELPLLACYLPEPTGGYRLLAGFTAQRGPSLPARLSESQLQTLPPRLPTDVRVKRLDSRPQTGGVILALSAPVPLPGNDDVVDMLAQAMAGARERAELARSNQRYVDQMTALHGFSLALNRRPLPGSLVLNLTAAGMRELSNAATVHILLQTAADTEPQLLTLDGAIVPLPAELGVLRPHLPSDGRPLLQEGPTTTLVLPLYRQPDRQTAMLLVYGGQGPSAADMEMLLLFATQASAALEANALLEQLRHTNEQLDTVLSVTHDSMLLVGVDGRIRLVNRAFVELLRASGVVAAQMSRLEGQPLQQLIREWQTAAGWSVDAVTRLYEAVRDDGAPQSASARHGILHRPGLDLAWTAVRPAGHQPNATWSALVTLRDITAAAQTERMREELSDMIVHDLRSPLTSVLSSFELSLRSDVAANPTTVRQVLTVGRQAALRLLDIVNMMLDINRLESGSLPLEPATVTLESLIGSVCDAVELIAAQKGQRLLRSISNPDCRFTADRALMIRLLQNLLDNAVKFTPNGGTITITAECRPALHHGPGVIDLVRISVVDTGPGIAPHALEAVFEKFTQLRQQREGNGLGLTFCKLVTDAHGGRIWAENHPAGGSAFHLELPQTLQA